MRVVFMGTPDFAVPTLKAIVAAGHEVALVVSQPDRRSGRGRKLRSPPVVKTARELGLPTAQPKALRSGPFPERYVGLEADVGVVIAYGRILPERLLHAPRHGCINVHASLLPRWRGAAPIQAALQAGDAVTGVCTQQMEPSLDTGPVYLSTEVPIGERETAGSLHDRLAEAAADVLVRTLPLLGVEEPVPQPEEGITWAPKLDKDSGRVDLTGAAAAIDRQIRAMSPWPGGWLPWDDGPLKLLEARPAEAEGPAGQVLSVDPLIVGCGSGALELVRVQAPGRRAVSGRDFANGARLSVGAPFAPEEA